MKLFKKLPKISKKTIVIASTLVLIVGIPAAYYLWASRQEDTRAWYDSNWAYRRAIQVNNPSSTLTDEDVLISVDTSTLVTAGKLQSDCDDLRFLDSDDTTTLSYWIEDGCNTTDTKVWIRVPSVPNGTKTIYMYYGNPTVSSASLSWSGVVTLFADASCPAGWTRNTDMDGKFLLGSDTYGTPGGSSSHSHSNASCSVSSASGSTAVAPSSGSFSGSTTSHTHSGLTASVGTNSNVLPPYIDSIMCSNNHFTIPTGLISIFNDTAPTGWTRFSAFDSKIPRGGASYGATGGSADHVHTTSGGFTTGSSSGSVSTSSLSTSTGADGAVTISSTTNLNTVNKISGRSCSQGGDAVNYSVTALSANTATVTPSVAAGCLSTGDEVLLINLQGTTSYFSNVGNYETLRVQSVSGTTVTFTTNKTNYYGNGSNDTNIGTSTSNQRVMLQRIPNYTNVTLNGTVHPNPWDGTKGGVIAFKASGTITVSSTGKISADEMGYRGGSGGTTISTTGFGVGAESYCGLNGAGRGGGYGVGYDGAPGICGGGGGGGSVNSSAGSGGAGIARGGGGAGGGQGGGNPARAGAGAGGGYGTGGTGGGGAVTGTSGGTNSSGAGGQGHTSSDAGGGGGGGTYGVANLSKLYLGSGGGGGGGTWSGANGGAGRAGGGIVLVQGDTINVSGNGIKADSYAGFDGTRSGSYYYSGPGGGGAGGSIKIVGNTLSLGSGIVTARGGAGGTSGVTGGTGGYGRIAVQYISSISGTTTPSSNNTQISSSAIASNPHTHVSATNPTTYEGNNLPPIRHVIFGKNDSSKYVTEANILVTNQLPPLGWNRVTDLDNYFPRGSTTYGTTEGSSTHTHEVSIETGGPSLSLTGLGSGYTFAGPSHTHSCVANTNSVSNMPPYISVIYTQRKVSLVTSLEVEETYNKDPNAPSNLLAEGVASPQQVTDTTPEFSAVFSDPDTGDTGVYYEIEVNTASDFTGAVMWDSGKIATTPITNGARSSDISYAGNTLTLDGSTYYWRIRFWDQLDGESPWSTISSFKMNTLPTISNLLTEGTTNPTKVADTTPEFSAICNDSDGDTCNYYEVEVNTSSDFTGTVMWDSGKTAITPVANGARSSDISYAGNTLSLDGSTYYWRMKFWDSIDSESSWSTTASFIMSGAPNQPSDLTVDGQVNPTTLDSLTPTFSAVHTDPNSDDAVYYEIEVNSNSLFSGTVKWDSGKQSVTAIPDGERSTEIAYDGTPLTGGGTTYYWRIRFWDTDDNVSDWSATAQFRDSIAKIRLEGLELEGIKIN